MKILNSVVVLLLCGVSLAFGFKEGQIVIKLTNRADIQSFTGRGGMINDLLETLIGEYTIQSFMPQELLNSINSSQTDKMLTSSSYSEPLSRIFIIKYEKKINPVILSKKVSSIPGVEYSEPIPEHKLLEIPNDPKTNGQWYLDSVNAYSAWDLIDTNIAIIVGIVDTGIDYEHEDLKEAIFLNPGEDGLDSLGRDKRTNEVDDDHNGFVDDWHGWDFISSSQSGQDNDPMPGHIHGTHVGGTIGAVFNNSIGIAGVGRKIKLIPVKCAGDNPLGTSVDNGYVGILYAASLGAKVINCSWGSNTRSESEQEVMNKVVELGAVVVSAAGNNGLYESFYPAAYNGVMSVSAINDNNQKAGFSNYNETIDVAAPGVDILATVPNNNYQMMDGTSMASPVAAGVMALVRNKFPEYNPLQAIEHLKATCDDITPMNLGYEDKIGKGRVNAFKAVSTKFPRSVILQKYSVKDASGDAVLEAGESVEIALTFVNVLSPVDSVNISIETNSLIPVTLENDTQYLGSMQSMDVKDSPKLINFIVPKGAPIDFAFKIIITISDNKGIINRAYIPLYMNPSFRNFDANNIATTINSRGNIGYNDYSENLQGIGFKYKGGSNLLFEGGIMAGSGYDRVSDVVRGLDQSFADKDFNTLKIINLDRTNDSFALQGTTIYQDNNDSSSAGLHITQNTYQLKDGVSDDIIFITYDVINRSGKFLDSVYLGLYFDWDIGPSGAYNKASYNSTKNIGYVFNVRDTSLPYIGSKLLTPQIINYYALNNGGSDDDDIGVYNGFSRREKWITLTNGMKKTQSAETDISQVISAGPIKMMAGDTSRIAFAFMASDNYSNLIKTSDQAQIAADKYGWSKSDSPPMPQTNSITALYPNPTAGNVYVDYALVTNGSVSIAVYDMNGKLVTTIIDNENKSQGRYTLTFRTDGISQGIYYLMLKTEQNTQYAGFSVKK
jgi:serine protease